MKVINTQQKLLELAALKISGFNQSQKIQQTGRILLRFLKDLDLLIQVRATMWVMRWRNQRH